MKLTTAQRRVLERMSAGESLIYFPDFRHAAIGIRRLPIQTFLCMARRELVTYAGTRWTDQGIPCGTNYALTDTGRAALAAASGSGEADFDA